jgi:hypothetical protein
MPRRSRCANCYVCHPSTCPLDRPPTPPARLEGERSIRAGFVAVHAAARSVSDPAAVAAARAAGHAVATAHAADHSLGGSHYALLAVRAAGQDADTELRWQLRELPEPLHELVVTFGRAKGIYRVT